MGDAGWGIIFVLGIAGFVTVIVTTVLWQIFQIARIKTQMSLDARQTDPDPQKYQLATEEQQ